jgi:tellurite methyltransferase
MSDSASAANPPLRAQDYAAVGDWPGYFATVKGKPPRDTLVTALANFERTEGPGYAGLAVDLGCGEGRDTREMLLRGWRVLAIDAHPDAFRLLNEQLAPGLEARLQTQLATFAQATWPRGADFINASYSLPFCPPEDFPAVWDRIVTTLRRGGRFAGQLFGDRDDWASIPGRSHHTRADVDRLLAPFDVEELREEAKEDGPDTPRPKRWHIFHIVARKR